MIWALLAAQAGAVEAERAFAADARKLGQWTAFRKWAAEDAIMFDPQPVRAQAFLRDREDPPRPVEWRPAESYASCDGTAAANTGPARYAGGGQGYFSTIWARLTDGRWRWTVDHGAAEPRPRFRWRAAPVTRKASCLPVRRDLTRRAVVEVDDESQGGGESRDGSLRWYWTVKPNGERVLSASLWTGSRWEEVIHDRVDAPLPSAARAP